MCALDSHVRGGGIRSVVSVSLPVHTTRRNPSIGNSCDAGRRVQIAGRCLTIIQRKAIFDVNDTITDFGDLKMFSAPHRQAGPFENS